MPAPLTVPVIAGWHAAAPTELDEPDEHLAERRSTGAPDRAPRHRQGTRKH